ncbi:MAG: sugar ABC transporter permease [Eubacteriales bacterium]|nr:sugar ABC transporter permease [Eubacteriales bacterium]
MRLYKRQWYIPYLFIAPFVLSFLIFFVVPTVYSFALSFAKYPGYGVVKWIGTKNYYNILHYSRFWDALGRTMFYWIAKFIPVTVISFMIAVCLKSSLLGRISKVYKPILFMPQVCAVTASALIFGLIFANQGGVINSLTGTTFAWTESATWSKWVVLLMMGWRGVGWFMVVYLSGLTSINPEIYEAARIDGANAAQSLFHITVPLMKQTFLFAFIMDAISSLRMYTEAAVLTGNAGGNASAVAEGLLNLLMTNLNSGNFGMACAYGWIIFVIVCVVSMAIFVSMKEKEDA